MKERNETFIIDIKDQQYGSWQGSISWINENRKEYFRSILEMVKLLDSAINNKQEKTQ